MPFYVIRWPSGYGLFGNAGHFVVSELHEPVVLVILIGMARVSSANVRYTIQTETQRD